MGQISDYNNFIYTRQYDRDIVAAIYKELKDECIELIYGGYYNYYSDTEKVFMVDEEVITAGIYGHIQTIIDEKELHFEIADEFHLITKKMQKGKIKPKKAKRFDLRITNFQLVPKYKFGVEAKLIAEESTSTKSATTLINDYVGDKGMGKFITGIYDESFFDEGFMLAYMLNGKPEKIVDKINLKITSSYSVKGQLIKIEKYYISTYSLDSNERELRHIFMDFSSLSN